MGPFSVDDRVTLRDGPAGGGTVLHVGDPWPDNVTVEWDANRVLGIYWPDKLLQVPSVSRTDVNLRGVFK